jgi:hypothetical protein
MADPTRSQLPLQPWQCAGAVAWSIVTSRRTNRDLFVFPGRELCNIRGSLNMQSSMFVMTKHVARPDLQHDAEALKGCSHLRWGG